MTNKTDYAVLLHAPTETALKRARNNATNLMRDCPGVRVEIVVNAQGVRAALEEKHQSDHLLVFCRNTLTNTGQDAGSDVTIVPNAVLHLVERQRDGWIYIRS